MTMAGASLSGMLAEQAEAVTPVQKRNFNEAVKAFNLMATTPADNSPLWRLLDPNVVIYDITFDHQKLAGDPLSYPDRPLQPVIDGLYNLVIVKDGKRQGPTFIPLTANYDASGKVKGRAQWKDIDGTGGEIIQYTFVFNGDLLKELHARDL